MGETMLAPQKFMSGALPNPSKTIHEPDQELQKNLERGGGGREEGI
jgi:hypothetical protein